MMLQTKFGYWPRKRSLVVGEFSINPLADIGQIIADVECSADVVDGWMYSPRAMGKDIFTGEAAALPYPSRVFGLPCTHLISHKTATNEALLTFVIWCFGFFEGMRFTETEAGFLDATPIERGRTNDIVWVENSLDKAVLGAEEFWATNSSISDVISVMEGVIHCFTLAANPQLLHYEKFNYLYSSLEGCHFVHSRVNGLNLTSGGHANRVRDLCKFYGIGIPRWADQATNELANVRNKLFHEGLFWNEPVGFQVYGGNSHKPRKGNTILELQALVSRLIVAILGLKVPDYISSPLDGRQRQGLKIL